MEVYHSEANPIVESIAHWILLAMLSALVLIVVVCGAMFVCKKLTK